MSSSRGGDERHYLAAIETDRLLALRACDATVARRDASRRFEAHASATAPAN